MNNFDAVVFVENIRNLTKQQNKTIGAFEDYAGVSRGYCSRLLKQKSQPGIDLLLSAESFFGVNIHELIAPMCFIKSCPHCGGECEAVESADLWYVYCPACGCSTAVYETKEVAIDVWNRRTKEAEP